MQGLADLPGIAAESLVREEEVLAVLHVEHRVALEVVLLVARRVEDPVLVALLPCPELLQLAGARRSGRRGNREDLPFAAGERQVVVALSPEDASSRWSNGLK